MISQNIIVLMMYIVAPPIWAFCVYILVNDLRNETHHDNDVPELWNEIDEEVWTGK